MLRTYGMTSPPIASGRPTCGFVSSISSAKATTWRRGGPRPPGGRTICGLNISRWEDGLLAEEWAVWETFGPD